MGVYSNLSEDVMLEFQGDDKKNQEYLAAVDKAEEALNWLYEDSKSDMKNLEAWMKKAASLKTEKDLKKYSNDFKNMCDDKIRYWNKNEYKAAARKHYASLQNLIKLSKTFNNTYSSFLMEKKKEIDIRFSKISDETFELVFDWAHFQNASTSGKKIEEFNESVRKMYVIDRSIMEGESGLMKYLQWYYSQSFNAAYNTFKFVGAMRYYLGISKEDTIVYKIINMIFK